MSPDNDNATPATSRFVQANAQGQKASASFNGAARRPGPKVLSTSPEVNIAIVNDVLRAQHGGPQAERAPPEMEAKIQQMLADIRGEVAKSVPEAGRMAEETKIYIVPGDKSVNMTSFTEISADGRHAKNAIVITQGAIDKLGTTPFKALLGHEFAHHLFAMNPELLDNPRYMPKSQAYKDELAKMDFTPTRKQTEAFKQDFAKEHNGRAPGGQEIVAWVRHEMDERKNMFKQEAMSDKVGLRLTKDVYAAQVAQLQMADDIGNLNQEALDHPHETANSQNRGETDPHPSFSVRCQENLETVSDMKAETGGQPAASRPPARNPTVKGPPGPGK